MYTLTYESKAIDGLEETAINDILETARSFNTSHGITGCLIFYANRFIQILEGPREKVKELFAQIENDKRHTDVSLFSEDNISERNFPDWGMAYYTANDNSTQSELNQFKSNLIMLADLSKPTSVTAMLFWKKMKFLISDE
ncbi:BLUF domain-containing protein [Tamlana crocina]